MEMRGRLFSNKMGERSIFRDETIIYPEHVPDVLPHREGEIQFLAECLEPAIHDRKPSNVFMFGPPGVGKTAVAKFVLRELKEKTDVIPIYVNCWQHDTRHAILTQILYSIGRFAPRRGTATDEIYATFVEGARKTTRSIVLVLDEIDKLLIKNGSQVLYDLLRADIPCKIGIVLISNDQYAMRRLDDRTMSSLNYKENHYAAYKFEELKDILGERVKFAFAPGAVSAATISAIANFVSDAGGDIRLGLECLLRAGRLADRNSDAITPRHVREVLDSIQGTKIKDMLKGMSEEHRLLLKTLAELQKKEQVIAGKLYKEYKAIGGSGAPRTFRKYVSDMEALGFLKTKTTGAGYRGKSRTITLKFSPDVVSDLLGRQ